MEKERLDLLAVQQGLTDSREKAKRLIMAGQIYDQNNQRYDKPGEKIPTDKILHIKGETLKYVSRGGLKLEKAIALFNVDPKDKIFLDIGSSTGGFTDVALQNGAKLCYALDVGYNQLDWKLRQDERVVVMERVNFRYSKLEDFTEGRPQMASIDVSFISLKLILPVLKEIIEVGGDVVALIKPQFEAGRGKIGKKGIVRNPEVHNEVLKDILEFASLAGFDVLNLSFSPITGGTGNIEFLVHLQANSHTPGIISAEIDAPQVVKDAYIQLKSKAVSVSEK
ncbi:s-adenosyl-l-methionine-dependent methyltransferase [Trichococcus palustris]|uniref:S-adenosyl-l-methionine-dependent methyltransferase n=1 Tax=Trichococcus palustris TaxID=140314 RepID=A0A143YFX2_9LACT|nr:TlyA family RNA methyltransferase [Trichococcus palustris]CZQ87422.1 s-adenosyl-l-methionine-dependent methyltransferase [Trichococcus palustris]SFK78956.1 23S rRNA (cytidine1920-2'-O)/16S rRNA (cytidine1409-2'-O)-methyltransferase [Trichococcus palustris]